MPRRKTRRLAPHVGLVECQELRHVAGADLVEHGPDRFDLGLRIGAGAVDDVNQEV